MHGHGGGDGCMNMKSHSIKSDIKPKLVSLLHNDMAFVAEDIIEAVFAIFFVICLTGIFFPMMMEIYGTRLPEPWAGGVFAIIWPLIPVILIIALLFGVIIGIIRYFRGGGGEGEIRGRVE